MRIVINPIQILPTRFPELGFANTKPTGGASWRVFDLQDGNDCEVGPIYPTKAELLADLPRYAASRGYTV